MIIRRFKTSDLDDVMQLFHDVVHSVGAKYYDPIQVDAWAPKEGLDRDKWEKSLTENITYVAVVDNEIVGFGDMTHTGYIDHMFVHKNYQGQGVAIAILKKFEEDARKEGITELTTEASVMAKLIAERQGFEVVRKQYKLHRGVEFINYIMRKKL